MSLLQAILIVTSVELSTVSQLTCIIITQPLGIVAQDVKKVSCCARDVTKLGMPKKGDNTSKSMRKDSRSPTTIPTNPERKSEIENSRSEKCWQVIVVEKDH